MVLIQLLTDTGAGPVGFNMVAVGFYVVVASVLFIALCEWMVRRG
jgi:hypothetical protein